MKPKINRFTRDERLRTSFEFKQVKRKIHLYLNQGPVKIYILKQTSQYSRLGIIVYKKTAKAFHRNKIKRWIREIFRNAKNSLPEKIDILFVVRPDKQPVNFLFLQEAFLSALQKYQENTSF